MRQSNQYHILYFKHEVIVLCKFLVQLTKVCFVLHIHPNYPRPALPRHLNGEFSKTLRLLFILYISVFLFLCLFLSIIKSPHCMYVLNNNTSCTIRYVNVLHTQRILSMKYIYVLRNAYTTRDAKPGLSAIISDTINQSGMQ